MEPAHDWAGLPRGFCCPPPSQPKKVLWLCRWLGAPREPAPWLAWIPPRLCLGGSSVLTPVLRPESHPVLLPVLPPAVDWYCLPSCRLVLPQPVPTTLQHNNNPTRSTRPCQALPDPLLPRGKPFNLRKPAIIQSPSIKLRIA